MLDQSVKYIFLGDSKMLHSDSDAFSDQLVQFRSSNLGVSPANHGL